MALIRGFFTADVTVLFELERGLTRLETEQFAVNGKPLPVKLARARSEMRTLLGIETSTTHGSQIIETSVTCSTTEPVTIGTMEASQILGRTPQMVRRLCTDGSLQAVQGVKNGSWRIFRASLAEMRRP
jgi:hypothetical protein